jgi:hypothetical protein
VPAKGWFVILRLHGPQELFFDKGWRPGEIVRGFAKVRNWHILDDKPDAVGVESGNFTVTALPGCAIGWLPRLIY